MLELPKSRRNRILNIVILVFCTALHAVMVPEVGAGPWQGTVTMRDGVEHVTNPKEPMEAPATIVLQEEWRIGGDTEAEEEFFGVIAQIAMGPEGDIYLLDQQLTEVKVFSRDGEYLRTLGREGEGPGEFRRPEDMFLLPDGNVGVLQLAPGRIVKLSPQGEPMGDHPLPDNRLRETAPLKAALEGGEPILFSLTTVERSRYPAHILAIYDDTQTEVFMVMDLPGNLRFRRRTCRKNP